MIKGDVENLQQTEAVEKIKELAEKIKVGMFCTNLGKVPFHSRPMSTIKVDDNGDLWFFSSKESDKNREIKTDDKVQVLFSNMGSSEFLSLYGSAVIIYDKQKAKEMWTPIAKAWFPGGAEDPDLSIIKLSPEEGYYWDTKHGKIVALTHILAAMVTGKTTDDGIEGKLSK